MAIPIIHAVDNGRAVGIEKKDRTTSRRERRQASDYIFKWIEGHANRFQTALMSVLLCLLQVLKELLTKPECSSEPAGDRRTAGTDGAVPVDDGSQTAPCDLDKLLESTSEELATDAVSTVSALPFSGYFFCVVFIDNQDKATFFPGTRCFLSNICVCWLHGAVE